MRHLHTFVRALVPLALAVAVAVSAAEKAMCPVCALQGEEETEEVTASSEYNGKTYYFCSKDCQDEFDADPEPYLPPVLPRPAPEFAVTDTQGRSVTLDTREKKAILVDFWATWCKPCERAMPALSEIHTKYADRGLLIAGISIDEGDDRFKKVQRYTEKKRPVYPVFLDGVETPAWAAFKVKVVPSVYLINHQNQIVRQWHGKIDYAVVEGAIQELLANAR